MGFSSSIKYQVGGREVTETEFFANMHSTVEQVIGAKVTDLLKERLGGIRCEEHDQTPTVTLVKSGQTDMQFAVGGCCDALKVRTEQLLQQLGGSQWNPNERDDREGNV
jgi:hypothetical protein